MMLTDYSDPDAGQASEKPAPAEDKTAHQLNRQPTITDKDYVASDNLEVQLSFQIGTLTLPLKELRQIRPGFSFDLQKRLTDHPVSIVANDQLFASGELVCIGDFIGVRIIRLSGSNEFPAATGSV